MMMVMDMAARLNTPLSVRVACLMHDLGKGTTPADVLPRHIGHENRSVKLLQKVCERLRVPTDCRELAEVVAREHGNIHRSAELNAEMNAMHGDGWVLKQRLTRKRCAC
jgi:tRNA nucleotidyltransferase (CCA-adding enzyme)